MKKKIPLFICALGIIAVLAGVLLLSSNSKSKPSNSNEPAIKQPKYSHSQFFYDNKISWDSSYTTITAKYGKPDKIISGDEDVRLIYKSPQIGKYTFSERQIHIDRSSGRMLGIYLTSRSGLDKQDASDLKNSMISKYGEPDEVTGENTYWRSVYADTEIKFHFDEDNAEIPD